MPKPNPIPFSERKCRRGHEPNWYIPSDGAITGSYCKTCRAIRTSQPQQVRTPLQARNAYASIVAERNTYTGKVGELYESIRQHADTLVVFDATTGRGSIPENLRKLYPEVTP